MPKVTFAHASIDPVALAQIMGVPVSVMCNKCGVKCKQVPDSLDGLSAVYECPQCGTQERVGKKAGETPCQR